MLKSEFPLGVTAEEALRLMSQELSGALPTLNMYYKKEITENVLKDSMKSMIMLAWGIFFSEMCDEADKFIDEESIEQEYQNFIEEVHSYFPKDCDTFEKTLSNFTTISSLSMIEQLSGKNNAVRRIYNGFRNTRTNQGNIEKQVGVRYNKHNHRSWTNSCWG